MEFIDLKTQYNFLKEEIDINIKKVLNEGQYIMGKEVEQLEHKLCEFTGVRNVITCASGTDAMHMLYMAYGIKPGDVVFCPDVTFVASVEPAAMLGAIPVFCDIDMDTYTISPVSLERQIKNVIKEGKHNPKFVIAVDFLGNPAHIDEIFLLCQKYNLIMLEDGAQSFGASYKGRRCCSFGHSATTSFFPAKPLGCYGDGGAVFTNDDEIAELCQSIRVHGKGRSKYDNVRIGMNSRLDTIQAAILLVKLKYFSEHEIEARQCIAERYNNAFAERYKCSKVLSGCQSVYAQYTILDQSKQKRNNLRDKLNNVNIPNMVYYPTPLHQLNVFKNCVTYNELYSNSLEYCECTISLPMHAYLTIDEQNYIIQEVLRQ